MKYFDETGSVQYQRDSGPLTFEDNFSNFDMPWLATLRDRSYTAQSASITQRKKQLVSTIPNPPSFYEDDMKKWENKFK
jgi:hypothetical protein